MIHAPAVVNAMVERNLNYLDRRGRTEKAERSGKVDPIETEHRIHRLEPFDALRRDCARRSDIKWVIGWKTGADLKIGDDARIERFGKRNTRIPGVLAARRASGKQQDLLCAFENGRRVADSLGWRCGRDRRHVTCRFD